VLLAAARSGFVPCGAAAESGFAAWASTAARGGRFTGRGAIAGLLPAIRAARLSPTESLRTV
jgi:hypothetical protein